ncbi:scavenger receptor cysteine-rich domain-containing protein DMBT1-like [Cetorhinus maximus]
MVSGVRNFSYEDSLKSLGLSSLESKSLGGELIDMFKSIRGLGRMAEKVTLRLVNGGSRCAGRVEIHYMGRWGTVYAYSWDLRDATVVCRELCCGPAVSAPVGAHFGEGTGPVVFQVAQCRGDESVLRECASFPWGHHYSWSHSYDAGVICSDQTDLRLSSGATRCSGRLETQHGTQWGTICDVYFGLEDAGVVCDHLRCGAVAEILGGAHFGKGTGPVWRENYRCRGNESSFWDCPVSSWDQIQCSHENDVSVICSGDNWSLRLTNGGSRCDGRVETDSSGIWGRVQDSLWDLNDSKVVCRELDCGDAIAAYNPSKYGESEGPVWVNYVQCEGNELHLQNCSSFLFNSSLTDSNDVGVLCSEHMQIRLSEGNSPCAGRVEVYYDGIWGSVFDDSWDVANAHVACKQLGCGNALEMTLPDSCRPGSGPIWLDEINCSEHKELRLVNGMHRCEGRVEVFYNGTWGTVCSESLDSHDAEVICKQLQCGHLASIDYYARLFGEGSGPIWLDEVECMSHESTIWQCQTDPWGKHNCHHREDAGVVCSESGLGLRLAGGNSNCSGRVEILFNNNWAMVCDHSRGMADANVVCRQLGCSSALRTTGGANFGQGESDIWMNGVECTGEESFLTDCPSSATGQPDCNHKEDASVICSGPYLSSTTSPSTAAGHDVKTTSTSIVICITLGVLLIVELMALMSLIQRKAKRKGAVTGGMESSSGFYQALYEEIDDIPPRIDSALTHGSALGDYEDAQSVGTDSRGGHLPLDSCQDDLFIVERADVDL